MNSIYARFQRVLDTLDEAYKRVIDELTMTWGHIKEKRDRLYDFFSAIGENATERAEEIFRQFTADDQKTLLNVSRAYGATYHFAAAN